MEKVIINTLPENSLFHFTEKKYLDKIQEEGLVAIIGDNAIGIEKTPKIFFSKGEIGILKVTEVWLRWLMNRIYGPNDRLKQYQNLTTEENRQRLSDWIKEFLSKKYMYDIEKKEQLFKYFYEYLKERVYLVLDIKDGIEYDLNDIDENKKRLNESTDYISKKFAKEMYGDFSKININTMEDWNMHTKSNINIDKSKIKQVITPNEEEDMLSIILYLYEKNKNIEHNKILLDDFIKYTKRKRKISDQELNKILSEEEQSSNDPEDKKKMI